MNLFEAKVMLVNDQRGHAFRIIENPRPPQVASLAGPEGDNELKGLLSPDGNMVLLWNAYHAHHMEALGLYFGLTYKQMFPDGMDDGIDYPEGFQKWTSFFLVDRLLSTDDPYHGEQRLINNRNIQIMMGGPLIPSSRCRGTFEVLPAT
jgi:hypothetical protein